MVPPMAGRNCRDRFGKPSLLLWLRHVFHGVKNWAKRMLNWDQIKGITEEEARKFELHSEGHGESLKFLDQGV